VSASPADPLQGRCGCGAIRFEVRAPFDLARYCHCHRCQHRTGTSSSANARVAREAVAILAGEEHIRSWAPEGGAPKHYCGGCGGHVFSGPLDGETIVIRLGAIEGDPGIRPEYRQWLSSAVAWEDVPDDGLPRYEESGPA
jgi:hypothetical protein